MADIVKPLVGKPGWNAAVDEVIDKVNAHDANPILNVNTAGVTAGQLLAVGQVSPLGFELVDTAEITPGDIGAQPADADLSVIAGLSAADNDVLQRKAGAWANRTPTQLKADLDAATTEIYIQPGEMTGSSGSPALTGFDSITPVWALDPAANESVCGSVRIPAGWTTVNVFIRGVNLTAGAGDVSLRLVQGSKTVGDSVASNQFTTGSVVTFTAAAQYIIQEVQVATGIDASSAKGLLLRADRRAADVTDTLAADWGLSEIVIRKAT